MTGPTRSSLPRAIGVLAVVVVAALTVGCGSQASDLEKAQAEVRARTEAVNEAQAAFDTARNAFCTDAAGYVSALERYGKVFTDAAATVGDVRTLGADLERPHDEAASSAQAAVDAHQDLVGAQAELAEAQADLEALTAGAPTSAPAASTTTSTTLLPAATVERVQTEQRELAAALEGVDEAIPLVQAGQQVNAAAYALEAAWLRVLAEAGCLSQEQAVQAHAALTGYATAVQTSLKTVGFYGGEIDGIYGPATVEAVQAFQRASNLPVTGYVDQATAAALESLLTAAGGEAAAQAVAATAALQTTLKLAGHWHGSIDGQWTQALTDALVAFQTALGVPATGIVDTATLEAIRQAISAAQPPPPTAPTAAAPGPTTTAGTTTTRPPTSGPGS